MQQLFHFFAAIFSQRAEDAVLPAVTAPTPSACTAVQQAFIPVYPHQKYFPILASSVP